MFLEVPPLWIAILNVVLIPVIHLGVSWVFTKLPLGMFNPRLFCFSEKPGEKGGKIYEKVFNIRKWKNSVPDAGSWFANGFTKNLASTDPKFIREFIGETCRGEACHVFQMLVIWILVIYNPWPANLIIIIYGLISNLPFILIQRHTRRRLESTFGKASSTSSLD